MPRVQNPSIGSGAVAVLSTVTNITAAQLASINTTPIAVIPAPGSGKIIDLLDYALIYHFGTRVFEPDDTAGSSFVYANNLALLASFGTNHQFIAANSSFFNASATPAALIPILPGADNQALLFTSDTNYNAGPIVTATLGAGGAGYVANDTGTITNGANDATYKVLTVGGGGAVLTFQITGAGTACTVANGNATVDGGAQPGVGAGFTVNITAVATGDGTLKVVTYYQIIAVP